MPEFIEHHMVSVQERGPRKTAFEHVRSPNAFPVRDGPVIPALGGFCTCVETGGV